MRGVGKIRSTELGIPCERNAKHPTEMVTFCTIPVSLCEGFGPGISSSYQKRDPGSVERGQNLRGRVIFRSRSPHSRITSINVDLSYSLSGVTH